MKKFTLPPILLALIGFILAGIFICSMSIGINFSIALLGILISIPTYALIAVNIKNKKTLIFIGILTVFSFYSAFWDPFTETIMESWTDFSKIQSSDLKLFLSKFYFAVAPIAIPLTFIGIIKK